MNFKSIRTIIDKEWAEVFKNRMVQDDFEKILVITHLEELKDVFPNRIEVEKTPQGSQLTVV